MIVEILEQEYWYGACVKYGKKMPIGRESCMELDFTQNPTPNQAMPLLVSTAGRYLWGERGFRVSAGDGRMEISDVTLREGFGNLRGAYLAAMREHFPFCGKMPERELFSGIIYNTWIELLFEQNQEDILSYAEGIVKAGLPSGVLMIDDGWAEYYGNWTFHSGRFPDARGMIEKLHGMGFQVMVWICPFVCGDTPKYREAKKQGLLIREKDGEPAVVRWWNGFSAALDMSAPRTEGWLEKQLEELKSLGVDGFKFDAGDSLYYREDMVTEGNVTPDEQSAAWARFGERYPFNEYRAAAKAGGCALLQRLCDKEHSWGENGIASLIPDMLAQGILGYPFGCPDMVGGGEYLNFLDASEGGLDQELFVRHCEIACLMPALQFSAAPWRILGAEHMRAVRRSLQVRQRYLPYLLEQLEAAAAGGEPVIRYVSYEFPDAGAGQITDQFMLGSDYLVAPVYRKGDVGRSVFVPEGQWIVEEGYGKMGKEPAGLLGRNDFVWFETVPGVPVILRYLGRK